MVFLVLFFLFFYIKFIIIYMYLRGDSMNFYFYVVEFCVAVALVLLFYNFVETRKIDKYTKKNIPTDLKLFIQTQKVDVKKIGYEKLMKIVAVINAIDVGLVLLVTNIVDNILLKLAVAIPVIFLVLFASYRFAGYILKRKGLVKDES